MSAVSTGGLARGLRRREMSAISTGGLAMGLIPRRHTERGVVCLSRVLVCTATVV